MEVWIISFIYPKGGAFGLIESAFLEEHVARERLAQAKEEQPDFQFEIDCLKVEVNLQ